MPWMSPRATRWSNPSARNIWWLRKAIKGIKAGTFNANANTWRWLYDWAAGEWNYRRNLSVREKASIVPWSLGNRLNTIDLSAKDLIFRRSFERWLEAIGPIYFDVDLVLSSGTNRVFPKKMCKAYREINDSLIYTSPTHFEALKAVGTIKWCPHQKDWYTAGSFTSVLSYSKVESRFIKNLLVVANPKVFHCPVCKDMLLDEPQNKKRSTILSSMIVCPACTNKALSNKPLTRDSIYGDYHSHSRSGGGWKFFPITARNDSTVPMGIELEMQFKQGRTANARDLAWDLYKHQLTKDHSWNFFYCERDGSIGDYGLEMITQPMTQKVHNIFWDHMLPFIRTKFVGWNTQTIHEQGHYGIHVTFDTKIFGQLPLARLVKFVENSKNREFIQGIAQRGVLYGGDPDGIGAHTKKISEVLYWDPNKGMVGSVQRNQAIHLKSHQGLCEIRMFRSTLNGTSFMKNLEFLWAFHHWCSESPFSFSADTFVEWLLKHPAYYYKYPNLYEFLCHEVFPVKLAVVSTENPYYRGFNNICIQQKKGQRDFFAETIIIDPSDERDPVTTNASTTNSSDYF